MHVLRFLVTLSLLSALSLAARTAFANGRFPATSQLVVAPNDPSFIQVRSTFGMLFSSDGGKTWDWICEPGVGYSGTEDPTVALTASGASIAALFEGLARSTDRGCSWALAGGMLAGQDVVDLALRPNAPHEAVLFTSTYVPDAGNTFSSRAYATIDDGATWTPYATPIDPTALAQSVEVAASDPTRLYVSATRGYGTTRTASLFAWSDASAKWTEAPLPFDAATEDAVYIAAVDPKIADRVYLRSDGTCRALGGRCMGTTCAGAEGTCKGRLIVSDDGGKTFKVAYTGGPLYGFALSVDGQEVYVGGPTDGLQIAPRDSLAFAQRSNIEVQCLRRTDTTLYACSSEKSGFVIGASSDDGATFGALLHLCGVRGPLACPSDSSTGKVCPMLWPNVMSTLMDPCPDAGPSGDGGGAGGSANGGGGSGGGSKCGCGAGAGASEQLGAFAALVAGAAVIARRRRATR